MNDIKYFTTSDLALTAALITFGISYTQAKPATPTRVTFDFEESDMLKKAISAFYSNALTVPASTYASNIKSLRGAINEILRESAKS